MRLADKTRHEAVWDWLLTCPHIRDLFFEFSEATQGGAVLAPLTAFGDAVETEFVDGSSIRNYEFGIARFDAYTTEPNDTRNLDALAAAEEIAAWVEQQAAAGNYPAFPAGCAVLDVEVLPSGEHVSAWDDAGAKYMLQIRIRYEKE